MPALVNIKVGSFLTVMGADGTIVCSFDLKNSKNESLNSCAFIKKMLILYLLFSIGCKNNLFAFNLSSKHQLIKVLYSVITKG